MKIFFLFLFIKKEKSQDALGNLVKKSIIEAQSKSMQNGDWTNFKSINISKTTTLFFEGDENSNKVNIVQIMKYFNQTYTIYIY